MADVTLLKTYADCDAALAALRKERGTYAHRDYNQSYTETQATERATTLAQQLSKATDDVAHYTAEVARPGLSATELRTLKRSLIAARNRRELLELNTEAVTGPLAYLGDVDADQVDAQIAVLDARVQDVIDHRATLSA